MKETLLAEPALPSPVASPVGAADGAPLLFRPWLWLNLFCVDAPLVAISWAWLFARSLEISIPAGGVIALFLSGWLIYLADRFGDSLAIDANMPTSLRQRFCLRHRAAWIAVMLGVALADLLIVSSQIAFPILASGAVVGSLAVIYLMVNRLRSSVWARLPLKELSIGFLFAAGTVVPLRSSLTSAAWPGWTLFACLCVLNCVSIAVWERVLDRAQGRVSIATTFPGIGRWLIMLLTLVALLGLGPGGEVGAAISLSAILLAAVHLFRSRIDADVRTALADLVLLTPLIFLLV